MVGQVCEERIREILHEEVVAMVLGEIPERFGSIKPAVMELFDEKYVALSEVVAIATVVAAAEIVVELVFMYWDFNNTKPLTFDGVQDPIIAMRWLSNVKG